MIVRVRGPTVLRVKYQSLVFVQVYSYTGCVRNDDDSGPLLNVGIFGRVGLKYEVRDSMMISIVLIHY